VDARLKPEQNLVVFSTQITGQNLHTHFLGIIARKALADMGFERQKPANENSPLLYSYTNTQNQTKQSPRKRPFLSQRHRYRDAKNIKDTQADELESADKFASQIGLHLNAFSTVAWLCTQERLTAANWSKCTKKLGRLMRRLGVPFAFVYSHENPTSKLGDDIPNTHFLAHRDRRVSRAAFVQIFEAAFNANDGGIKIRDRVIGNRRDETLAYLLKGVRADSQRHKHKRQKGSQGIIAIKRVGTSQNIGRAARASR